MNSYYFFWTLLIVASLWVSLGGFLWAYRRGQFRDQERARFMALRDEAAMQAPAGAGGARHEAFVVIGILAIGISAVITVLVIAVFRTAGGGI